MDGSGCLLGTGAWPGGHGAEGGDRGRPRAPAAPRGLTGGTGTGKRGGSCAGHRAPSHLRVLIKHLGGRPEREP